MSRRYRDHDDDRGEQDYGRSRNSEYGRNYGERSQGRYGSGSSLRDESERYSSENRWRGQYGGGGQDRGGFSGSGQESYGGREDYGGGWSGSGSESQREFGSGGWASSGRGSQGGYGRSGGSDRESQGGYGGSQNRGRESYGGGREDYNSSGWDRDRGDEGRGYGSSSPLGLDAQRRFREASSSYSRNYDYPNDSPSRDMYSNAGGRTFDYDRSRYGRGQERGYDYESDRSGSGGERGWWDRASDTVASWFGDEEAERRRRMDEQRDQNRGRGPKGYRRSDDRIKEDVNDRLSEGYLDASDVEVQVQNSEVTLTGTVNSRQDKRRAEDIAESVSGVSHVENRIRVKQRGWEGAGTGMGTGTGTVGTEMSGLTGTTGTTGTTGSSMGTTGTTGTTGSTGTTGKSDTSTSSPTSTSSAAAGGTGTGSGRSRT